MIFDLIVKFLLGILNGVLGLIPEWTPDLSAVGSVGGYLAGLNSVFPAVTLGACILAIIGLELFLFTVTVVTWIWDKVPFKFS